jgi:hypothetical protein
MCSRLKAPSFSQGPGNFRDIAQNRRNDVTFPRMGSFHSDVLVVHSSDGTNHSLLKP